MTIYEKNLEVLKQNYPILYKGLESQSVLLEHGEPEVFCTQARNKEICLTIKQGENMVQLNSTYNPGREAERFAAQFENYHPDGVLLLFGFGNGMAARMIMQLEHPPAGCIIYEPSLAVFQAVLEHCAIDDLLANESYDFVIEGINQEMLDSELREAVNYRNWNFLQMTALPKYTEVFEKSYILVQQSYYQCITARKADYFTLTELAQLGLRNSVAAHKWIPEAKCLADFQGMFPKEVPLIIVAAGPSLEKNAEELRKAKNHAVIFCVDAAANYLLERDIIPDLICTVDTRKELKNFKNPKMPQVPLAITPESNCKAIELLPDVKPIYVSTILEYYTTLFEQFGGRLTNIQSGGSVANTCFEMGIYLDFHTIILVGQDLALADNKAHAGDSELTEEDVAGGLHLVDGYYGDKVYTRGDFDVYINYYNMRLAELTDRKIINATEGGAKLKGAEQMPLREAIQKYCTTEVNVDAIYQQAPKMIDTEEKKMQYYQKMKDSRSYFKKLDRVMKEARAEAQRGITLLRRGNYSHKELSGIEKKMAAAANLLEERNEADLILERVIEQDVKVANDLHEQRENVLEESIRLFEKSEQYMGSVLEALEELLPMWEEMLQYLNQKYQFEQ